MSLTRTQVEKVALLARLELSEAELASLTTQLQAIVGYVDQLAELKTDNVEPLAHPLDARNVFRDDILQPSFDRAAMLANAPAADDECYRVPAVLGE